MQFVLVWVWFCICWTASLAEWLRHPPREQKILGSNPTCAKIVSGLSHTSDLKIGTPVATLPGAWRYRVSAGTGRPGVSILWLGEVESWICNFYLSVAARQIEQIRPWYTLACCWDFKQATNQQTVSVAWGWQGHVPRVYHSESRSVENILRYRVQKIYLCHPQVSDLAWKSN